MNSLFIKDFRYGLDTRKSELTSRPGTLEVLSNGFINQGGEIENRKAFVRTARISGTFGLQSTSGGLYNFGSSDLSASHPVNIGTVGVPIYVYYQRLQHPARLIATPIAYEVAKHLMTAVVFSTEYRGKAFVVATFADGNKFCYYDGTLMYDFVDGVTLNYMVNDTTAIATAVAAMVDRQTNYSASAASAVVTVTGPLGQAYDLAVDENAAGSLTAAKTSDPTDAILARNAVGSFEIVAGSASAGTNKISSVEVGPNGGTFVTITSAAVDWTGSNENTAVSIAANINTHPSSTEYTAEAQGAIVVIKALATAGDTPNDYVVRVNAAGDVCIGKAQYQVMAVVGETAFVVNSITVDGVDIKGALSTTYSGTPTSYASAIATAINAATTAGAAHGYLANAFGPYLSISKAVTRSDDAELQIYFDIGGAGPGHGIYEKDAGSGSGSGFLTISLLETPAGIRTINNGTQGYYLWKVVALISGGNPPYLTLEWINAQPLDYRSALVSSQLFNWPTESKRPFIPSVTCKVTDSSQFSVTAKLPQ